MLCTTQIVQRPLRTGASVQRVYQFVIIGLFVGSGFIVVRSGPLGPVSLIFCLFVFCCLFVFLCQSTNDGAKVQICRQYDSSKKKRCQSTNDGAKVQNDDMDGV